jgi:uncharacterized damage-inducible protein DinB
MHKDSIAGMWDSLRQIHGITLRVIQLIPKDKIDSHPIPKMRSPKEVVAHMYTTMRDVTQGVAKGQIISDEGADSGVGIKTHDDLVRYAEECWRAADRAVASLSEAQLTSAVKTPWGVDFPGFVCIHIIYDEHLHHRGQLFTYLRALGGEPPMMWDFENNAPEYRPRAAQKA